MTIPLSLEQQRIKALFEGNPLANLAQFNKQEEKPLPLGPTASIDQRRGNAFTSFTTPSPFQTETQETNTRYQNALRNRLARIQDLSTGPTQNALAAARQQTDALNSLPADYQGKVTGNEKRDAVLRAAASQKGMPYSWGGGNSKGASYGTGRGSEQTLGFDCSGLVQYAYAQVGIKLPRYSDSQLAVGVKMPISKLQPGDLVGKPGHIAIYAGNGMMWESPTFGKTVRLAPVRQGMFGVHISY